MRKLFLAVLIGMLFMGCNSNQPVDKSGMDMNTDKQSMSMPENNTGVAQDKGTKDLPVFRKANKDEIGKQVVCPVMGDKFIVKENTDAADYKGKSYYFCCGACPPQFKENPDKYAK